MQNKSLSQDYLTRAKIRLKAVATLFEHGGFADTVRESQEIVELALKALLRFGNIEVPRIHDVSEILRQEINRLPKTVRPHIDKLADISRELRRDRELSFYGSEDLTPSEFYKKADAEKAKRSAEWVVETVAAAVAKG